GAGVFPAEVMKMREYQVRPLERGGFAALMRLEEDAFAGDGAAWRYARLGARLAAPFAAASAEEAA
ncbi:MAG: hypothetical protein RL698_995, partial [Pseudomonadota bacterium]